MPGTHWIDMGAGAGFPGLVVAALAKEHEPTRTVALIESDARKAAFLTTAAHAMGVGVDVRHERVEHYTGPRAEVISARAFAPLPRLLFYAEKLRVCRGICLFPKGVSVHKEIAVANRTWRFTARMHTSITDLNAIVLEIGAFERV
jgi:16S rRNA (guanine527-N7)-methyltransferase